MPEFFDTIGNIKSYTRSEGAGGRMQTKTRVRVHPRPNRDKQLMLCHVMENFLHIVVLLYTLY